MNECRLKQVRVGAIFFDIERVDKLIDDDGSTKLDGDVLYSKSKVRIDSSLEGQKAKQVLWHEILHILLRHANVEVSNLETICDVLSNGIMQVMYDNEMIDTDLEV